MEISVNLMWNLCAFEAVSNIRGADYKITTVTKLYKLIFVLGE
jgi:hypothetical protein